MTTSLNKQSLERLSGKSFNSEVFFFLQYEPPPHPQSFLLSDPIAARGLDNIIPSNILSKAKGLAIFTVIKAGFMFSGRAGSGVVVARLEDGSWSAPSAIGTGGMGFGGQIGAEITDFVMVLNSREAVKSFTTGGNITLGGNLSGKENLTMSVFFFSEVYNAYPFLALDALGYNKNKKKKLLLDPLEGQQKQEPPQP